MNNLNIDPALIEKAAKAQHDSEGIAFGWENMDETDRSLSLLHMEAAIRVVFEELGLKEEKMDRLENKLSFPERRLVSDWKPIKP